MKPEVEQNEYKILHSLHEMNLIDSSFAVVMEYSWAL